jgi:hypothetical protein
MWGSLIGAVGGKLIDGFFGRQQAQAQAAYQNPKAIRNRMERAGFNPLLAFNGNGAGTIAPSFGQSQAASNFLAQMETNKTQEQIANAQLEQENKRLKTIAEEMAIKDPSQSIVPTTTIGGGVAESADGIRRPAPRPTMGNAPRVPVFNPAGDPIEVPKTWAERMGITPWGYLAAGEYAELVGEIRGEGEAVVAMGDIARASGAQVMAENPHPATWPSDELSEQAKKNKEKYGRRH